MTDQQPISIFTEDYITNSLELEKLYQQDRPALLFVKKGTGSISLQINHITLNEYSVVLSETSSVFKIHSLSKDFEARAILYTYDFIEKLGLKLNKLKVFKHFKTHINSTTHLPPEEFDLLWTQIESILHLIKNETLLGYNEDVMEHLFSALIYTISGFLLKQQKSESNLMTRQEKITFEFIKNVFENFKEEKLLQFYADQQQMTIRHLSSVVKTVTLKTANQVISEFVMNEAKILLSTKKTAIQDIADQLKFSDPYSFSHFFKKHSGVSPHQYRQDSHK